MALTNRYTTRFCALILGALAPLIPLHAQTPESFRFESIASLDDMRHLIETDFPLGSTRETLRQAFVEQGKATLKSHPTRPGVEKYIYDINLCSYYVWRWNISADFDTGGRLIQAYMNGEPLFAAGPQKRDVKDFENSGHRQSIYKVKRLRPEASKGEKELAYILVDADSNTSTIDDQLAMGGGPSRAHPVNMGKLRVYTNVDPWRSIFDRDDAAQITQYTGDCKEADALYARQKAGAQ